MATKERLLALDVMRGVTIAAMLLVNNPGSWSNIYAPLQHAAWNGMTPTDLIYPFFMFIMGVSTHFSLRKYEGGLTMPAFTKILRRSILMFVVGMALQWFTYFGYGLSSYLLGRTAEGVTLWQTIFPVSTFRIMGVLQGLAVAYFFGSIIAIWGGVKRLLPISAILLVVYSVMLHLGNGYELAEDNIIAVVDRAILGASHLYKERLADGSVIAFEPEAILSSIPRIAHVMIGIYAGSIITSLRENSERINKLMIVGAIMLFLGLLLQYGEPINKKIWSSTYTLATCGFASIFLALLIWIIDVRKFKGWCGFFEAYGINPLFLYVAGWVFSVLFGMAFRIGDKTMTVKSLIHNDLLLPILGDKPASLAWALLFVVFIWGLGYILYRKKIYIKL